MPDLDEKHMQMALKLAQKGVGSVEPNPAVGCVIVKGNQVIGKGWHKKFGAAHAEINAIEDCRNLGANPAGAAMYVTLEPCCHQGQTAPCTDAVIAAKLAKVVVATIDPSEHANGKGIEQLRDAGIEVQTGVCENEARLLNAPFIKFAATGKCWVVLKWAQTIDGKMAWADGGKDKWISNEQSRKDAHGLRRRTGTVLVGINTVLADDPLLTARPSKGKEITRIVLDSHLRIPLDSRLLASAKKMPVIIVASKGAAEANPQIAEQIRQTGAELFTCPDTQGQSNIHLLLDELSKRRIPQLLVEGGSRVITSFLKEGAADEIHVYVSPRIVGSLGAADIASLMAELTEAVELYHVDIRDFDGDIRLTGLTKKVFDGISAT